MMAKFKLSTRFTLLLVIIGIGGILGSGVTLWRLLEWKAQQEVQTKGLILIDAMKAVRGFTASHIQTLVDNQSSPRSDFVPETVPAFSARVIFEDFQQHPGGEAFSYKEASLNPTNPKNKADAFEASLIEQLRSERSIQELSGFRSIDNRDVFFIARPLVVNAPSCLPCHSTPQEAPAEQVAIYGSSSGFDWQLNDVIAAQVIYVSADEVFNTTMRSFLVVMGIFSISFVLIILLINLLLRHSVIRPVSILGALAQKVSHDELKTDDLESNHMHSVMRRSDELGNLAQVFRDMAHKVYARTEQLKQQVRQLRIEIDEVKRQKQVSDIVDSDYFKDLQSKVRRIRQRPDDDATSTPQDQTQTE